jgi:hypothetical protein
VTQKLETSDNRNIRLKPKQWHEPGGQSPGGNPSAGSWYQEMRHDVAGMLKFSVVFWIPILVKER